MTLNENWLQSLPNCSPGTALNVPLDIYFKHSVYKPFEMLRKTPDIRDLITAIGEETRKVAHKADTTRTKLLA